MMTSGYPLQSIQGPTDPMLRSNAIEGYTQVSRIGESVINSFVDSHEYGVMPTQFTSGEFKGTAFKDTDGTLKKADGTAGPVPAGDDTIIESKPHFYEWATATVGMLAVQRRMRSTFRNYVAAETAAPVVVCAAMRGPLDELDFQFAGVVRSNSVRTMDDGVGPTTDEYFTLSIGGLATILNNSNSVIHPGDYISWTFVSEDTNKTGSTRRATHGSPRRIGIKVADFHDENVIGKAEAFAKPGTMFDILLSL